MRLKYDSDDKINIETDVKKQLCNMSQSEIDDVKIKQQVDSDSDVEVDLAYRVIDTFNKYEVKTFKQDDEEISTDCETSLKLGLQYGHTETRLKLEMDKTATEGDLDNKILNHFDNKEITFLKENVEYENLNFDNNNNNIYFVL